MYEVLNFLKVDYCDDLSTVIKLVKSFISLIRFGVPIILIVMGTLDLAKAVISSKEDEMKKAQGALIKRILYAIAVFLVVTLVSVIMGMVADSGAKGGNSWKDCWNNY